MISNVEPVRADSPTPTKVVRKEMHISTGTFELIRSYVRTSVAAKRGLGISQKRYLRSYNFTDIQEWIKYREEDASIIPTTQTSQVKESTPQPDATIPAPTGVLADQPCPICKEKFHSEWDEEKEDWVWKNAIQVGGKIYHASCYAESRGKVGVQGVGSSSASRSGTPQPSESLGSILGKRKGISNNPEASKVPRLTE
jgi:pre-mRNA cleavage complex 2 protein Pcf11